MSPIENFVDASFLGYFATFSVGIIFGAGLLSGVLKTRLKVRTNYTRKLFHFIIFSFAGVSAIIGGFNAVLLYGGVAGIFVLTVLMFNGGNVLYEGIAREEDAPHRSVYILVPFIATATAGILGNLWFGSVAVVGYVVAGWGDAVGELIGVRFGKHAYRTLAILGMSGRSLEGSLAVLVVSLFAVLLTARLALDAGWALGLTVAVVVAVVVTFVEAVTPHGLDNLTTQLVATALASLLIRI